MATTIQYYHNRRNELIEAVGGECFFCGSKERLEFHHLESTGISHGMGGWDRLYKMEREGIKTVTLLCRECHIEEHKRLRHGKTSLAIDHIDHIKHRVDNRNDNLVERVN